MFSTLKSKLKFKAKAATLALVKALIRAANLDSREIFYAEHGILKWREPESGETWFMNDVLPRLLKDVDRPVFIDVGANVGEYAIKLVSSVPRCVCYSLEPNPVTFEVLEFNTNQLTQVVPLRYGAGCERADFKLYAYSNNESTSHASLYSSVLTDIHSAQDITAIPCLIDAIDAMVEDGRIPETAVHFVKIDTEGHELEALKGAMKTIATRGGIRAIQFEFNEMNVMSRVFLKDFYDLISDQFLFYRLDSDRLLPLGDYNAANEIFKYQNIVCLRKELARS